MLLNKLRKITSWHCFDKMTFFSQHLKIRISHKFTISVDVFNFANLLNKDWGRNFNLRSQTLLFVTGFDQATKQYNYRVNENVGVIQANRTPYQVQIGARYGF